MPPNKLLNKHPEAAGFLYWIKRANASILLRRAPCWRTATFRRRGVRRWLLTRFTHRFVCKRITPFKMLSHKPGIIVELAVLEELDSKVQKATGTSLIDTVAQKM